MNVAVVYDFAYINGETAGVTIAEALALASVKTSFSKDAKEYSTTTKRYYMEIQNVICKLSGETVQSMHDLITVFKMEPCTARSVSLQADTEENGWKMR